MKADARKRVKRMSVTIGVVGISVLILCGRDVAFEQWYLFRLKSVDCEVFLHAATKLAELGSTRAVPVLLDKLRDGDCSATMEAWVTYEKVFSRLGQVPIAPLLYGLRDPDEEFATECMLLLVAQPIYSVPVLCEVIGSEDRTGMRLAVRALGMIGLLGRDCMGKITSVALRDSDWRIRVEACFALGCFGDLDEVASDGLIGRLYDPVAEVRVECLRAICRVISSGDKYEGVLAHVIRSDINEDVRLQGIECLTNLSQLRIETIEVLRFVAREDLEVEVRDRAQSALRRVELLKK